MTFHSVVSQKDSLEQKPNQCPLSGRLALQSESFPDKLNLPNYIVFWQPPHLALPDHMQNLVALNRSPRAIE
jgi:hypothetical protein